MNCSKAGAPEREAAAAAIFAVLPFRFLSLFFVFLFYLLVSCSFYLTSLVCLRLHSKKMFEKIGFLSSVAVLRFVTICKKEKKLKKME